MNLRQHVLRSAGHLAFRNGVGTFIAVGGVLLLTRALGPSQFGLFAAAAGFFSVAQLISQLGINIYLIRYEGELPESEYHQAATLLLLLGLLGTALGGVGSVVAERWTGLAGLAPIAITIFMTLPLAQLTQVPLARIERKLDYVRTTRIELAAQASMYLVAIPLAFMGRGVWAAVAGWWTQHLTSFILFHAATGFRPQWHFNQAAARRILHYGSSYTASIWIWHLRRLVNPLVVGRLLGAEAVAIVSLTAQLTQHLTFVIMTAWRLATAVLARVQSDRPRMLRAINDGMWLQTLAVGCLLVVFGVVIPFAIPHLLGSAWGGIALLYPFIAIGVLVNAAFNLQSSALYVLGRNWYVAQFHLLNVFLLGSVTFLLGRRYGLIGYGIAEVIATLSYLALQLYTSREIGRPRYARLVPLWLAFGLAFFWRDVGIISIAGLALVAVVMQPWRQINTLLAQLRGSGAEAA